MDQQRRSHFPGQVAMVHRRHPEASPLRPDDMVHQLLLELDMDGLSEAMQKGAPTWGRALVSDPTTVVGRPRLGASSCERPHFYH